MIEPYDDSPERQDCGSNVLHAGVKPRTHGIAVQDTETGEWFDGGMFTSKAAAARQIAKNEKMGLHAHRVIIPVNG